MEQQIARIMTGVHLLAFFVPGVAGILIKPFPFPIPVGAITFVAIVLWLCWASSKELKRELEQARAKSGDVTHGPQRPSVTWKRAHVPFSEHRVLYAVEYPLNESGDLAAQIHVSNPRCLQHGTPMVGGHYHPWRCNGCGLTLEIEDDATLQTIAKSQVLKRVQPEVATV